jgi:hypothetical protein
VIVQTHTLTGFSLIQTPADFNSNEILTDAQLAFVSSKYRIISLEKCTGIRSGVMTEDAIYATAQRLKKADPKTKVIFYLATDQQGLNCYAANATFAAHPEWWLKDDKGTPIVRTRSYQLDPTNAEARAWWTSIPMKGDGNGTYKVQNYAIGLAHFSHAHCHHDLSGPTRLRAH